MNNGETILWINNWCYTVLVSPELQRQGMYKCVAPLGKTAARGDLFDQLPGSRPSESHAIDSTPWISYGLSIGASRDRGNPQ
jgi:hypothetical protein